MRKSSKSKQTVSRRPGKPAVKSPQPATTERNERNETAPAAPACYVAPFASYEEITECLLEEQAFVGSLVASVRSFGSIAGWRM